MGSADPWIAAIGAGSVGAAGDEQSEGLPPPRSGTDTFPARRKPMHKMHNYAQRRSPEILRTEANLPPSALRTKGLSIGDHSAGKYRLAWGMFIHFFGRE
jgi:hypothetical protein